MGRGVVCVTLRLYPIKGIYVGHLQWDSTRKAPTAWDNLYGDGSVGNGGHHFSRDSKISQIQRVLLKGGGLESS